MLTRGANRREEGLRGLQLPCLAGRAAPSHGRRWYVEHIVKMWQAEKNTDRRVQMDMFEYGPPKRYTTQPTLPTTSRSSWPL